MDQRVAKRLGLVMGTLLIVVLAGCVDEEITNPRVTMTVTDATGVDVDCNQIGWAEECHIVTVRITNDNEREEASTNMFYWRAAGSDGDVYEAPWVEGPDAIRPSNSGEVKLGFDVPKGVNLETVFYEAIWMTEPTAVTVPLYTVEEWDPNINVTVMAVENLGEDCWGYGDDKCHRVKIHVENNHSDESVSTNSIYWETDASDGGSYNADSSDGPDRVRNGGEATINVEFNLPAGIMLETIWFEDTWMPRPLEIPIPEY